MWAAEQWLLSVAVKKVVYGIAKGAAGILVGLKAKSIAASLGITVDTSTFEAGIATFMWGALAALHDWAKLKWPDAKWL